MKRILVPVDFSAITDEVVRLRRAWRADWIGP